MRPTWLRLFRPHYVGVGRARLLSRIDPYLVLSLAALLAGSALPDVPLWPAARIPSSNWSNIDLFLSLASARSAGVSASRVESRQIYASLRGRKLNYAA